MVPTGLEPVTLAFMRKTSILAPHANQLRQGTPCLVRNFLGFDDLAGVEAGISSRDNLFYFIYSYSYLFSGNAQRKGFR